MRQQGILTRIIALFALLALVLPASASVASCMDHAKSVTCCMAHQPVAPQPKLAEVKEDCCHPKPKVSVKANLGLSSANVKCQCKLKSAPTRPSNAFALTVPAESVEVTITSVALVLPAEELSFVATKATFYADSSPPGDPHGSPSLGRAPPVSVL